MADQKNLRVLVVEDSEFDARMLVNLLRQGGYAVSFQRVETAETMLAALKEKPWDILLADYNLPTFNALAALRLLQESGLDLPFIIVSGGIGEDIAVAAMKAGAHDYLMKGQLARLVPAVERELREAQTRAERRRVEEELRESELRYRLLWENSADAVLLMDTDSNIHFANPAVEKVFGYAPEEVLGRNLTLLLPERLRPDHEETFIRYLRSGVFDSQRRVMETVGRAKDDREVLIEIAFNDLSLHGKRWFVAFIRDITERKRAEEKLRQHQETFEVARRIQQRLFPKSAPNFPPFDIAGVSYPAEAAGGDYFDYLHMIDGCLAIVIADVTGHGVGPALLMAETRAYLRVLTRNRDDVGEILRRANLVLAEDVDLERYVTLQLTKLDQRTMSLIYTNAGHPTGYVLDRAGQVKAQLKRTGVPLGLQPDARYAPAPPIGLSSGDLVLLLTDGIEEAMSPADEFFGSERLFEIVRQSANKPAREIVDAIYQSVRNFSGNRPPLDDLTMVVVKVG